MTGKADAVNFMYRFKYVIAISLVVILIGASAANVAFSTVSPSNVSTYNKWTAVVPPTYEIFTDGTTTYAKNGATGTIDYSGTDPALVLRNTLSQMSTIGGGKLFIKAGTYTLQSKVTWYSTYQATFAMINNVEVYGEGMGATVLKLGNGVGGSIIGIDSVSRIHIHDLTLNGNRANQVDSGVDGDLTGIKTHAATYLMVDNVEIRDTMREGFYPTNSGWNQYSQVIISNSGKAGLEFDSPDFTTAYGIKVINSGYAGIRIVGGAVLENATLVLEGAHVFNSTQYGIYVKNAYGSIINGAVVQGSGTSVTNRFDGIYVENSERVTVSNSYSYENDRSGILTSGSKKLIITGNVVADNSNSGNRNDSHGISLLNTNNTIVTNNMAYDHKTSPLQYYGISESSPSTGNVFIGNTVRNNAVGAMNLAGTNHLVGYNDGYVTSNKGSATIASATTSVVVTHGLSYTPTAGEISITPTNNPTNAYGNFWITSITSTQFTVNVRSDPGASGLNFDWSVRRIG